MDIDSTHQCIKIKENRLIDGKRRAHLLRCVEFHQCCTLVVESYSISSITPVLLFSGAPVFRYSVSPLHITKPFPLIP